MKFIDMVLNVFGHPFMTGFVAALNIWAFVSYGQWWSFAMAVILSATMILNIRIRQEYGEYYNEIMFGK